MRAKEKQKPCGQYLKFTIRNPDTSTTYFIEGKPSVEVIYATQVVMNLKF